MSSQIQIRVGLANFFQPYSTTMIPTRQQITQMSLTKFGGGHWQVMAEFEIMVFAKNLPRDNVQPQLGNIEREIQRMVCMYKPNDIDGVEDMFYIGQDRIYGVDNNWAVSNWQSRIIIALKYSIINDEPF